MATYTIIRSPTAIAVGLFFTGVTAFCLLDDVFRHGAPLTLKHIMTCAVLFGTIYFGHRFKIELKGWRWANALGCALLFAAGTVACVLMSAGRNAEVVTTKVLAADSDNGTRQRAELDRNEAKARYDAALKAETDDCNGGAGPKCLSKRATTELRRHDLDAAEHWLKAQKPRQIANADIRASAELLARLPFVTSDAIRIEALLLLAFPFLQSLFCEIGAIVGFAVGIGHGTKRRPWIGARIAKRLRNLWKSPAIFRNVAAIIPHRMPSNATVVEALRKVARPVANYELAGLIGCSPGECSRRVARMNGQLRRQRVGHCIMISLAT